MTNPHAVFQHCSLEITLTLTKSNGREKIMKRTIQPKPELNQWPLDLKFTTLSNEPKRYPSASLCACISTGKTQTITI